MEPNPEAADTVLLGQFVTDRSDTAFAGLVGRYVDLVYAVAVRRVGDRHLAEDVTQAVFVVLARRATSLGAGVVLPGWLHRTARLISNDAIKMTNRRHRHERAAARPEVAPDGSDTDLGVRLDAALDRLSTADRDAVLLRYWQGLSVAEVAARLGVAENTAAKRLGRAIDRLRSQLADAPATFAAALPLLSRPAAPAGLVDRCSPGATSSAVSALASRPVARGRVARPRWPVAIAATAGLAAVLTAVVIRRLSPGEVAAVMTPAVAAPPLSPTSADQDRRVRAAVYTLRHFHPFARVDDWPRAIRTLVEVGRPAVPELVAELDRTTGADDRNQADDTLRAIGYTLRCIGDARACPALIRALRRTPAVSSGLGLDVADADLAAFLRSHQPDPAGPHLSFGVAAQEVLGALSALTRHDEGGTFDFPPGRVTDATRAAARRRLDVLADGWQAWWDANGGRFVTPADVATLTAGPHDAAAVEAAGVAVHGPLFPTGRPFRLGPVHDVWLDGGDDRYDRATLVSFDRQRTMSPLDAIRLLPPGVAATAEVNWTCHLPVSVDAECHTVTLASPAAGRRLCLYPIGPAVWPVDDAVWDALPATMAAGRPVLDGVPGPYADFAHTHPPTDAAWRYPATFLFRTNPGGAGIVRVVGQDGDRLHVQFRTVDPPPPGAAAVPPLPPVPTGDAFGDVRQVVVRADVDGRRQVLSLSSGRVTSAPPHPADGDSAAEWVRLAGGDLTTTAYAGDPAVAGVRLADATVLRVSDGAFDTLPAAAVAAVLAHRPDEADSNGFLMATGPVHRTAVVVARDGTAAVVQVTDVSQSPPSATVRYKLLTRGVAGAGAGAGAAHGHCYAARS